MQNSLCELFRCFSWTFYASARPLQLLLNTVENVKSLCFQLQFAIYFYFISLFLPNLIQCFFVVIVNSFTFICFSAFIPRITIEFRILFHLHFPINSFVRHLENGVLIRSVLMLFNIFILIPIRLILLVNLLLLLFFIDQCLHYYQTKETVIKKYE